MVCIDETVVKVAVLLPAQGGYPFVRNKTLPAINIAIDKVRNSSLLQDYDLDVEYRDSACSETMGPLRAIDLYVDKLVNVYMGPCCDYAVAPIARFSAHWNIPVLSAGAPVRAFDNKTEYPLLTRIEGSYRKKAEFVVEIARTFNWSVVGLLFHDNVVRQDRGRSNNFFAMEPIFHLFKAYGMEPSYKSFDENVPESYDTKTLLTDTSKKARSKSSISLILNMNLSRSFYIELQVLLLNMKA